MGRDRHPGALLRPRGGAQRVLLVWRDLPLAGRAFDDAGLDAGIADALSDLADVDLGDFLNRALLEVCGVAEADTVPLSSLTADSSSIVADRVSVGFVTVRRSAREVTPSGTRGLVLNWGHSEDFSLASMVRPENELRGEV